MKIGQWISDPRLPKIEVKVVHIGADYVTVEVRYPGRPPRSQVLHKDDVLTLPIGYELTP